ncbi:hypothetical protein FJY69_00610 [candidate division WOR-3 bacterium]|nr:hypothetical protein [candidate division WOR-3 bacterium]
MRKTPSKAVLVALFVLACGGSSPTSAPKPAKGGPALPAEALELLTEQELATFKQALPAVGAVLARVDYRTTIPAPDDPLPVSLGKVIEPIGTTAGVPETLAAIGMDWKTFRATLYKLTAATAALGADMFMADSARWSEDTSAMTKEYASRVRQNQRYTRDIPEANKRLTEKHIPNMEDMAGLVRQ